MTNSGTIVHAQTVTAFTPVVWLWNKFTSAGTNNFIGVNSWDVSVEPGTNSSASAQSSFHDVTTSLDTIGKWVPRAEVRNGRFQEGAIDIGISSGVWSNGILTVEAVLPTNTLIHAEADFTRHNSVGVAAQADGLDLRCHLEATETNGALQIAGPWIGSPTGLI